MKAVQIFVVLWMCLAPTAASAAKVVGIEVWGNSKTTDETVIYLSGVDKGDDIDTEDVDAIEKRLVSSGLFKGVTVYVEKVAGGIRLIITAKDKWSWAVAPTYYNQPTNKGFGFGFGENNLFGKNKKLLLYGQVATGDTFFIAALQDPQVGNTFLRASADIYLRTSRIFEYSMPTSWFDNTTKVRRSRLRYLNGGLKIGASLFRSGSLDFRIRGAHVAYSETRVVDRASIEDITGDPASTEVPDPGKEGFDVSGEIALKIERWGNWYGIVEGWRLGVTYERAFPELGSDFDYYIASAAFRHATRLFKTHNFIIKAVGGYGKDLPFQQEFSSGGTSLRGFENNQFRGDLRVGGNATYSLELFNIKGVAVRPQVFWDSRYTAFIGDGSPDRNYLPGFEVDGLAPLKNTIGAGMRLYIRQIVLPLLGVDVGYGIEANSLELFLAIGISD